MVLAGAAVAAPAWLPIGRFPLISFDTEAVALLAWGLWLAWIAPPASGVRAKSLLSCHAGLAAALAVLALPLAGVAISVAGRQWPLAIGARHGAVVLAAIVALLAGARLAVSADEAERDALMRAVLWAFVLAGVGNALVAILQYLGVAGPWDPLDKDGRARGNLGQPNLLGTQLLWAYAALVALAEPGPPHKDLHRWAVRGAAALLVLALAFTASRSAALGCGVLALWGLLDQRLRRPARWLLLAAPVALLLAWIGLAAWQGIGGHGFAGTGLMEKADPTSSRWRLWQQCAVLIRANPWFGVGWGQFNFAWTLSPMPGLPRTAGYTFTHAHNLVVQWAVELGLPLTLALVILLACALLGAARTQWRRSEGPALPLQRAAVAMVLIVLVHSQFEFPLWYVNFLLPTAFLLGMAVVRGPAPTAPTGAAKNAAVAPLLMSLAAAFALLDYRAIAAVYTPPPDAPPLEQRIAAARRSLLFADYAERFAGTLAPAGQKHLASYRDTVFEILDWRLLGSWAQAHAEAGQIDRARYLAARLREFDSPAARNFFAICQREPQHFQCRSNQQDYGFADFRHEADARPMP